MKYNVTAYLDNDREITVPVSCRWDAKTITLYRKSMNALGRVLIDSGVLSESASWAGELPNIWVNGAVGSVWFQNPFIPVSIVREDGCVVAG